MARTSRLCCAFVGASGRARFPAQHLPGERPDDYLAAMDPIALLRAELRKDNPLARRAKRTIQALLQARIRPNPIHRFLLAERSMRRIAGYELARILYYQPLFELQCAEVRGPGRLDLTPESKLPYMDN